MCVFWRAHERNTVEGPAVQQAETRGDVAEARTFFGVFHRVTLGYESSCSVSFGVMCDTFLLCVICNTFMMGVIIGK